MISITHALETLVISKPYLYEMIHEGLINYSSLARKLKPEVEEMTMKTVSVEAVTMALRRLQLNKLKKEKLIHLFSKPVDMIVRSRLMEITISSSEFTHSRHVALIRRIEIFHNLFFIITKGVFETTIIFSDELLTEINAIIDRKEIISEFENLSAITLKLHQDVVPTPGAYYHLLKLLAFEGINITEVASTYTEFTIILDHLEVDKAFKILNASLRN